MRTPPQQTSAIEDAAPAPMQAGDAAVTTPETVSAEEMQESAGVVESAPEVVSAPVHQEEAQSTSTAETLSAQTIDAIARRVIEQMSDKVVRDIAWEIVPELSELLIKRKLEEQK